MKKKGAAIGYISLFIFVFLFDRVTKQLAISYCAVPYSFNDFFSCDVTINRGISWGMFDSQNPFIFFLVTSVVFLVMTVLAWYCVRRWKQGHQVIGEVCALAGAFSNVIDRFVYKGVLDFFIFRVGSWAPFGVFNGADVAIVIGALLIFIASFEKS